MGKVLAGFAMSVDGFIADANDDVQPLFKWLANGDTAFAVPGTEMVFMTSPASAEHYRELFETTGAHVTGRRDFDVSRAWGGKHPLSVPVFVVTHTAPQKWTQEGSPFSFVTEGIERAIEQAQAVAGNRNVVVGGSTILQQCLRAGLIDEIHIDLVPVLLGRGIRLFDYLNTALVELDSRGVVDAPGVTHLRFRVVN